MKILVSVNEIENIYKVMGSRLNPNSYFVCYDIKGNVVFVPVKTSRHSHVIVIVTPTEKEQAKVVEWARSRSFAVLSDCVAMPES